MTPHTREEPLTPSPMARLQHRAARAQRAGRMCRIRPQTLLALCARLAQAEAQAADLEDTYHRLVEEHDAGIADWVRLLEVLGLSAWTPYSTVSATVVARVEALLTGVPTPLMRNDNTKGGPC